MEFYLHFSLDMARSPGFGSIAYNFDRPVKTRSRFGFSPEDLNLAAYDNSPDHSTKGTRSHVDGRALGAWKHRVSGSFHSPPGVLFTFPSQYCFTIGHWVVFRLGWWSTRLPTGFHVPRGTLVLTRSLLLSSTRLSLSSVLLPRQIRLAVMIHGVSPYPGGIAPSGLAMVRFRSPLLTESRLMSFPRPT